MSEISDMIQRLCPDGVEYRKLGEVVNCLSLSARRGALANYLKLTALRPLGFSRTSPYRSKLLTALHEKSPAQCAELQFACGERGSDELLI